MLNLIKKDFILHKLAIFIFLAMVSLYLPVVMAEGNGRPVLVIGFLWTFMLPLMMSVREEKFKGNILFCSLPFKRGTIVLSRYISSWVFIFLGILYSMILVWMANHILYNGNPELYEQISLTGFVGGFIFLAILNAGWIPLAFRFGMGKGAIVALLLAGVVGFLLMYLSRIVGYEFNPFEYIHKIVAGLSNILNYININYGPVELVVSGLLFILIINLFSFRLSLYLFKNRDLV